MFRARKPSVPRTSAGKHVSGDVPVMKQEPRAAVEDIKPEAKPKLPSGIVTDVKQATTNPLRPKLPSLPLPESNEHHINVEQPRAPQRETYDTEADVRYWQNRNRYKPWHADDDQDDDEDLRRDVRKSRKIAPDNDPLLAQIFEMFPEEPSPQ